jgi:hypothetical protein
MAERLGIHLIRSEIMKEVLRGVSRVKLLRMRRPSDRLPLLVQ